MRVVSINVAHLPRVLTGESARRRASRRAALQRLVARERPDVLMLQEAWAMSTDFVTRSLGFPYVVRHDAPAAGCPITLMSSGLVIASLHPLQHVRAVTFRDRFGIESLARKGVLFATCMLPGRYTERAIRPVAVATTHMQTDTLSMPALCRNPRRNRHVQVSQATQLAESLALYIRQHNVTGYVLAGDFNVDSLQPARDGRMEYGVLRELLQASSPFEEEGTYPTAAFQTPLFPTRSVAIDHCFSSFPVLDANVANDDDIASDHAAITTDLHVR